MTSSTEGIDRTHLIVKDVMVMLLHLL